VPTVSVLFILTLGRLGGPKVRSSSSTTFPSRTLSKSWSFLLEASDYWFGDCKASSRRLDPNAPYPHFLLPRARCCCAFPCTSLTPSRSSGLSRLPTFSRTVILAGEHKVDSKLGLSNTTVQRICSEGDEGEGHQPISLDWITYGGFSTVNNEVEMNSRNGVL